MFTWEAIWTGELLHLNGLPHLTGVPCHHVNRPLVSKILKYTRFDSIFLLLFLSTRKMMVNISTKRNCVEAVLNRILICWNALKRKWENSIQRFVCLFWLIASRKRRNSLCTQLNCIKITREPHITPEIIVRILSIHKSRVILFQGSSE